MVFLAIPCTNGFPRVKAVGQLPLRFPQCLLYWMTWVGAAQRALQNKLQQEMQEDTSCLPLEPRADWEGDQGEDLHSRAIHARLGSKTLPELGLSPTAKGVAEEKCSHSLGPVPALGLAVGDFVGGCWNSQMSQASIFSPISLSPLKAANGRLIYPSDKASVINNVLCQLEPFPRLLVYWRSACLPWAEAATQRVRRLGSFPRQTTSIPEQRGERIAFLLLMNLSLTGGQEHPATENCPSPTLSQREGGKERESDISCQKNPSQFPDYWRTALECSCGVCLTEL